MKDKVFLNWLYDFLIDIHNFDPNVDYMMKLKSIAYAIDPNQSTSTILHDRSKHDCKEAIKKCKKMSDFEIKATWDAIIQQNPADLPGECNGCATFGDWCNIVYYELTKRNL